jgi:hypothetical protein
MVGVLLHQLPTSQISSVESNAKLILAIFLEVLRDLHTFRNKHILSLKNILTI